MIATLSGKILFLRPQSVIIGIQGVGYKVFVTTYTLGKIASLQEVFLHIHTHVREDIFALYGFLEEEELALFELLIGVSGIGPKAALSILSLTDVTTIQTAILNEDSSILTRVPGIGKKIASRVILELKNKVADIGSMAKEKTLRDGDVIEALVSMGYSLSDVRDVLKVVPEDIIDIGQRIKRALKELGKK